MFILSQIAATGKDYYRDGTDAEERAATGLKYKSPVQHYAGRGFLMLQPRPLGVVFLYIPLDAWF